VCALEHVDELAGGFRFKVFCWNAAAEEQVRRWRRAKARPIQIGIVVARHSTAGICACCDLDQGRAADLSVLTVPGASFGRFNGAEQNVSILTVRSVLQFS
jgi:hypothetical protein